MTTRSRLQSVQHHACRAARSPVLLLLFALLYAFVALLLRDGDDDTSFAVLRGSGDDADEVTTPVDEWEPEVPEVRLSYGEADRGPVKGGVEIYPVQNGRRPRKARKPVIPEVAEIEGVLTAWKMPDVYYTRSGGESIKGLYIMFHDCNRGPLDWFDLPEGRGIVHHLVKAGYAVVAPASSDRVTGCWKYNTEGGDINPMRAMLWRWYRDWSIPPNTPLFLFGVSSGGDLATFLGSQGGFQLCDKRSTFVRVSGVLSQVSWGIPARSYSNACPPLAFMPMPKGGPAVGAKVERAPPVFGTSGKIPPHITAVAHKVRRAGGRPRMLYLPLGELSIYKAFFSDRVYEISPDQSERLYSALLASRSITCSDTRLVHGQKECFLSKNPRGKEEALDTLVATYEASQAGLASGSRLLANTTVVLSTALAGSHTRHEAGNKRSAMLASGPEEPGTMTAAHAKEVFRELLNVAWGVHEVSADFVALWETWMWDSCGTNCRPGPWR